MTPLCPPLRCTHHVEERTGAQRDGSRSNGDELSPTQKGAGRLVVTVIKSACDGHHIKELGSSAEVGTLCVAVVRQSSEQALREIWGAVGHGIATAKPNNPRLVRAPPVGISSLSTGVGATLRTVLRRYLRQASAPRGGSEVGTAQDVEACLVHYCKLPGGVIMSSPLDGPAFRLRQQVCIVDDEESTIRETSSNETQQVHIVFPLDL